jgi:hypothetical protein
MFTKVSPPLKTNRLKPTVFGGFAIGTVSVRTTICRGLAHALEAIRMKRRLSGNDFWISFMIIC